MYGTRKLHPGSKSGSAKSLKQLRGPQEDDDILEMDDLVVKSTAPAHLIEDDRPNPNRRRNNRDRNRVTEDEDQESSPATASDSEEVAYPVDEVNDEDRPERFAEVKKPDTARSRGVQEFRPSKDGKRGTPKKRAQANSSPTKPLASKEKSKGLFGWIKSVFTSEDGEATRSSDGKKNGPTRIVGEIAGADKTAPEMAKDAATVLATVGLRKSSTSETVRRSCPQSDSQSGNRPRRRGEPQADGRGSDPHLNFQHDCGNRTPSRSCEGAIITLYNASKT